MSAERPILEKLPDEYEFYEDIVFDGNITNAAPIVKSHERVYIHLFRTEPGTGFEEFVRTIRMDNDQYLNLESLEIHTFTRVILGRRKFSTYHRKREEV